MVALYSISRCFAGLSGAVFLITWARCSRNYSDVDYMNPPDVVESWLLLPCQCVRLTFWLADYVDQPWPQYISCSVRTDPTNQNFPQKIWPTTGSRSQPTTSVLVLGPPVRASWYRSVSGAACEWPRAFSLEPQSDPQCMATSAVPGYVWEGPICSTSLTSTNTETWSRSAKDPMHPKICLHLLAAYWVHWKSLWWYASCMR